MRGQARGEARLVLHLVDDGEAGGGVVLGDQQPDRVGADVDGGDAARRSAPLPPSVMRVAFGLAPVLGVMLDRLALHQEDHVLADVGGEVGHPLQVPAHQEELHAGADRVRVLHHVGEQDAEHRAVQRVHLVVAQADLAAGRGVAADERLERVGQHLARQPRHLDDLGLGRDRPALVQPLGRLGDVDRVVAHPLEVVGDLERGGEHPEVAGHRLLEGEEVDALLLDLDLHAVDDPVARDHRAAPSRCRARAAPPPPGSSAASASPDMVSRRTLTWLSSSWKWRWTSRLIRISR